jgi:hypothetical protein
MSLYLTNVDIMGNTKIIEENQSQTNKIELDEININTQSDKIILNEEIKEKKPKIKKKKKSIILDKKNELNLNDEIKYEYVRFLIEKNIKYANMNKIEEYYLNEINKKNKIYNDNLNLIQKKKNEIKEFIENTQNIIMNKYTIYVNSTELHDKLIERLKEKAKIKENDLIIYKHMKKRLSDCHIRIIERIQNELLFEEKISNQYSQYQIIQNHAIFQLKAEEQKLNIIKYIQQKKEDEQEKELYNKIEEINNLNENIKNLEESEDKYERQLRKLFMKIQKNKHYILSRKDYNKSLFEDNKIILKEYYQIKLKLEYLFYTLQFKNSENVISNYNNMYEKLNQLKKNFFFLNNEIMELTSEYSNLDKQLIDIKNKIVIQEKNYKINKDKYEEKNFKKIKGLILLKKQEQDKLKEKIRKLYILLNRLTDFLYNQVKNLSKTIPRTNSVISDDIQALILKEKEFLIDLDNINLNICLKKICHFFFQFANSIAYIILSSFSFGINSNSISQRPINIMNLRRKSVLTNRKSINHFSNLFDHNLTSNRFKEDNIKKEKVLKKNNSHRHLNIPKQNITENEMFQNFIRFLKKKDKISKFNSKYNNNIKKDLSTDMETKHYFLMKNYTKLNNFINKYENELVEKNHNKNKKNNNNNKNNIINLNNNKNETKSLNLIQSFPCLDDDLEFELDENEDNETNKKQKIKKKNPLSLNKFNNIDKKNSFLRMDDLRNLNSHFFKKIIGGRNKNENNLTSDIELQSKYYEYLKKEKEEKKKNTIQFKRLNQKKHKSVAPKIIYNEDKFEKKRKKSRSESKLLPNLSKLIFNNSYNYNMDYNKSNLISPINNLNLKKMKRSKSVFENNDNINKKLQFYSPFNKKKNYPYSINKIANNTMINFKDGIFSIYRKNSSSEKINKPLKI